LDSVGVDELSFSLLSPLKGELAILPGSAFDLLLLRTLVQLQ
jgi:hypothetical protein